MALRKLHNMRKKTSEVDTRRHSRVVVDGLKQTPSRAMLRAVGFVDADFKKPQVGVASTWSNLTPCNMHIDELARLVAAGADEAGAKAITFNTITVSDGISMGTPGMRYSLVSREVIADSIETVVGAQGFDGVVAIGGCDKNMPGCMMALARLDRPAVFVYGGTIRPGADNRDIVSVFEAVGGHARGTVSEQQLKFVERTAIPGPGACAGMYTANTMASAIEAMGMSLPNSSAQDAISSQKRDDCRRAGAAVVNLIQARHYAARHPEPQGAGKRDHGGHCAGRLDQCCAAPFGDCLISQRQTEAGRLHANRQARARAGGSAPQRTLFDVGTGGDRRHPTIDEVLVGRRLAARRVPHGDRRDPGRESSAGRPLILTSQAIVRPLSNPIKKDSHLVVLYGNLAPAGAVAKITGKEGLSFKGKARVFDSEEQSLQGILNGKVKAGDVVVIRYEGPKGRPGHA